MTRDPFFRQIVECLKGPLDPELFELCAADLLRSIYPTLVPIHGGRDSGMDGAIADGKGEPFPLVTTTQSDIIGNLTRSLESYLKDGGKRRKVILATSQELTPIRRKNLHKRANAFGFTLIQIYDRISFATLLYSNPKWCKELLNLTGSPPSLSINPKTKRPLINLNLVGRDKDLSWLKENKGDGLIVGQPGSGKTFLLQKYAREEEGLFVVSQDLTNIAGALRSESPKVLIIDDAQINSELILSLKQMRESIGADFKIIASCWPGDKDEIAQNLNLPNSNIHNLDLLTRDEILEIIKETGIQGPNHLIYEILNQSEGKPGLAVTLSYLCLKGDFKEVVSGETLSKSILNFIKPENRDLAKILLGAFSIGGDFGMSMEIIAKGLNLNMIEVWKIVVDLAFGGVITETDRRFLSVRPPTLRYSLVKDVFFKDAISLDIQPFLEQAPSLSHATLVIIKAKARGADVPGDLIHDLIEHVNTESIWEAFAWLGKEEVHWIITNHPQKLINIAVPALYRAPETSLPLLLDIAIGYQPEPRSNPRNPIRIIGDWVKSGYPGSGQALERREVLFISMERWLLNGGNIDLYLKMLPIILSPNFEDTEVKPGSGRNVIYKRGYLLLNEMHEVKKMWPVILEMIRKFEIKDWKEVFKTIESWLYIRLINVKVSDEMLNIMNGFAAQMLKDVLPLLKDHPGALHRAKEIAKSIHLDIKVTIDEEFEILYPKFNRGNWIAEEKKHINNVRNLAVAWSKHSPHEIIKKIKSYEKEARIYEIRWPRWIPVLCKEIANMCPSPIAWIKEILDADLTADILGPFLWKAATIGEKGWINLAESCLDRPNLKWATISLALTFSDIPEDILRKVLMNIDHASELVKTHCIRKEIPEVLVKRLLCHGNKAIANAAAIGEWASDPYGTVRESLQEDWQNVVINGLDDDYSLSEILKKHNHLAYEWLLGQLKKWNAIFYPFKKTLDVVMEVLDTESRKQIIDKIPSGNCNLAEIIRKLVNDNMVLYRYLLDQERLKKFHLIPLSGHPEGAWIEKAKMALDAGYSIENITEAAFCSYILSIWSGNWSDMWDNWIKSFDMLCLHEDVRIRLIGEKGKERAMAKKEIALEEERKEAIYGIS